MVPCPSCGTHLRARDRGCFACGAATPTSSSRASAVALLLGLTVACTGTTGTKTDTDPVTDDTGTLVQPAYGVTVTTPDTGQTTRTDETGELHTAYTGGVDYGTPFAHSGDEHSGQHSGSR